MRAVLPASGSGAGSWRAYVSLCVHTGDLQVVLMMGLEGDGFLETSGHQGKEIEKGSFDGKTEFISFKLQMRSGPLAGKKETVMFAEVVWSV